jgi:hypothetical protein
MINEANVTVADLVADNGVVHVIDQVLIPVTDNVNETERVQFSLFPNPTTGSVNIQVSNIAPNTGYQVVNSTGALVKNGLLQPGLNTVDLSGMASGLYLMNIYDENGVSTERLMIK